MTVLLMKLKAHMVTMLYMKWSKSIGMAIFCCVCSVWCGVWGVVHTFHNMIFFCLMGHTGGIVGRGVGTPIVKRVREDVNMRATQTDISGTK